MELIPFFGTVCTISTMSFQLVGIQICYGVIKKGNTGDMSPFTFIMYFVSCAVWLKYGLIQKLYFIIGVNLYGGCFNLFYTLIFYKYSTKKNQFHRYLFIGAIMLVSPLTYLKYYQTDLQLALSHLGSYCVILTVIGYGAPLISLADVVRTKSTESLSLLLISFNFYLSVLWTIYGGLIKDKYVQAPNILGGGLALLQLSLFLIYPAQKQSKVIHS